MVKQNNSDNPTDEQIMSRLQAGDKEVFRLLVRRHEEPLRIFCCSYCRWDVGWARELAQDIFVRVYERRDDYDSKRPFRPWLFTLARNYIFNQLDKTQRRRRRFFGLVFDRASTEKSPEEQFWKNEQVRVLYALIQKLPFKQREILNMALQGLRPRDISDIIGASQEAVRNNLMRGMKKLKKQVTKTGFDL